MLTTYLKTPSTLVLRFQPSRSPSRWVRGLVGSTGIAWSPCNLANSYAK